MGNWFYSLAILMATLWIIAFFGFHNTGIVHFLLLIAFIAWVYGFIQKKVEKKRFNHH